MAETSFEVRYDGPALSEGRMPVRDLAPALLALGELLTEASEVAFPDREAAGLNIRATNKGSFAVYLGLQSPDAWDQTLQVLSGSAITALANVQSLVFGDGGLLWLIRKTQGAPAESTETLDSGVIRLIYPEMTLEASPQALALFESEKARLKAREVVAPLTRPGVDTVTFERRALPALTIEKDDLPAFEPAPAEEEVLNEREYEAYVTIVQLSFSPKYKWRVSEGGAAFTADFADESFREAIRERRELFGDGDRLRVRMRVVQKDDGSGLKEERTILEVIEHFPRKDYPQTKIDFREDDD